ncbi:MAG: DNA-3-methyladenine glycosylase I [Gemmatimonas sp.]|nr:DNA-3-methyladenine glycosylase I [Gemmatimonas sp.]
MSYCIVAAADLYHARYHDTEYGFPVREDGVLFERLILEINQAGLSWLTILKKREGIRNAYDDFDIERIASYGDADRARLLDDARIIRNRLKVNAAIENAKRTLDLIAQHGSFTAWLDAHHPMSLDDWKRLFKKTFVFTGGEIVREFLVSTGYLSAAHDQDCPVYTSVLALQPPWAREN